MKFLLDTNICIYLIKKKPKSLIKKITRFKNSDIGISAITVSELEYGVEKSEKQTQNRIALIEFLKNFETLPYNQSCAKIYGEIRTFLEKKGQIIGAMDLLIGSHGKAFNLTVVTNNQKEFKRIPGLKIENWVKKQ